MDKLLDADLNQYKQCHYCTEEILFEAKKCKHCRSNLDGSSIIDDMHNEVKKSKVIKRITLIFVGMMILSTLGQFISSYSKEKVLAAGGEYINQRTGKLIGE